MHQLEGCMKVSNSRNSIPSQMSHYAFPLLSLSLCHMTLILLPLFLTSTLIVSPASSHHHSYWAFSLHQHPLSLKAFLAKPSLAPFSFSFLDTLLMATGAFHWKEMLDNSMSSSFILSENLVDVLLRLPVKSITRFKSVCRSWQTLFGDPDFINMHLRRAATENNCCRLLKYLSSSEEEVYSLRGDSDFAEFRRLRVPVPSKTDYYQIVGSSNGLICLTESNNKGSYLTVNTFLWNPSVADQWKPLPKNLMNNVASPFMVVGLGFAFHPKIDDYKVVRIVYFLKNKRSEVHVYSLRKDAWKTTDAKVHCHIHDTLSRSFVNGALHWLAAKKNHGQGKSDDVILSFDMAEDNLSEMVLRELDYDESSQKCLAVHKDLLSVFVYSAHHCNGKCDMWAMDEYGVAGSWTKRFTFCLDVEILILLDVLDNGEVVMQNRNGELVACDPSEGKFRALEVSGPACLVKYVESLVSLNAILD